MRALVLFGCALAAAEGGAVANTGVGGREREVDEYAHGIFRLRVREAGKETYEVSDVVVVDPLPPREAKDGEPIVHSANPKASLTVRGHTAQFRVGDTGAVDFSVTQEDFDNRVISASVNFPKAQRLYGIPEHAVDMSLKSGVTYRLMNLDVYMYKLQDPGGIYGSKPFMHAHSKGHTVGVFWMNSADTSVKVEQPDGAAAGWNTEWTSQAGNYDVFFLPGPTPQDVLRQYSYLTGHSAMHPQFSLGYHQCRWNYRSEQDTLSVDEGFDIHHIPYDVIWLDIEHTEKKKYFTWDPHNFPNPKEMINTIASKGRKVVTISDPHIKREAGYHVHDEATTKGYYVMTKDGKDYEGDCWPGKSSWLDFYNSRVRNWYAGLYAYDKYPGSTPDLYTWIDMNEPSVFNSHETTMDMDAMHARKDGFKVTHRELHNMYGYYQSMATYQGLYERTLSAPHEVASRPFILSRAFFSGSQRYAAVWTGDNLADWSHLEISIPMLLSMSLAGLTFVGADVGGFFENPDAELLVRWYQIGAFYPFFRGHAHLETKRREPWLMGDDNTVRIRNAIAGRYRLMPYIYTQFWRAHAMGESVIMPLYFAFPEDEMVLDIDRQMLLGESIMVKPVVAAGQTTVSMYLPGADPWYHMYTGQNYRPGNDVTLEASLEQLPALVRGGAIVPRKDRVRRSTSAQYWDPYTLLIALDRNQAASGDLYIDDTHSFEFQKGAYVHRRFTFANNVLTGAAFADDSAYRTKYESTKAFEAVNEVERVVIYGLEEAPTAASVKQGDHTATLGAADLSWDAAAKVLTVRRPKVVAAQDFTITFAAEQGEL